MRLVLAFVCVCLLAVAAPASPKPASFHAGGGGQPPQPPQPQTEFVPLSEVPPAEQIPAFTLVAVAYGFVWVALLGYVWSVSQRLRKVERELEQAERKGV